LRPWLAIILFAFAISACEKDVPIIEPPVNTNLAQFLAQLDSSRISNRVFSLAGNHTSFEREMDEKPFRVLFFIPKDARDFQYFESDSIQFKDSLELYQKKNPLFDLDPNGLFGRFHLGDQPKRLKLIRISFSTDDSIYISAPFTLKNLTEQQKTSTIDKIAVEVTDKGNAEIIWSSNSSVTQYLLWLEDRAGDAFCGVYTFSSKFIFYDLRNVNYNLTPSLFNPRLVLGEEYKLKIAALDENNWMRTYRSVSFIADTLGIKTFEH
jgi:hypothetical protein